MPIKPPVPIAPPAQGKDVSRLPDQIVPRGVSFLSDDPLVPLPVIDLEPLPVLEPEPSESEEGNTAPLHRHLPLGLIVDIRI